MDDQTLFQRQVESLAGFYSVLPSASPDSSVNEFDGVHSVVFPATPKRSLCNAVNYQSAAQLERAYDGLVDGYAQAGIAAWTVWVPYSDTETARMLEHRGHKLDGNPRAMAIELSDFDAPDIDVEIDKEIDAPTVGALNDRAYGMAGDFERALTTTPEGMYLYGVRIDGEYRACVAACDFGDDCNVWFVATDPGYRGRGLARALMTRALTEGRERGQKIATLQATKMGFPIYERLGYRDLGEMQMWEMREAG